MTEDLSSKARALVAAGRAGYRPSLDDRARVADSLRARLGPAALPQELSAPQRPLAHPVASAVGSKTAVAALVGVCLIGGGLFLALRSSPPVQLQTPTPSALVASDSMSPPSAPADSASIPPVVSALPAAPPAPASSSRSDQLAQEVALLSRATSALRAGRAGQALSLLNEHQRKFPNGVLTEERRAAKAQALCSLGRQSEGRAELSRLTPKSPAAVRAQRACGSGDSD